jgi:RNA polymerase subunit RPABC4/transcription elongation factor Spt4
MTFPTPETIASYLTIFFAIFGALTAAFWLSLVIWAFRDMRLRSRDPFAQILAALLVAAIPFVGIVIYLILRPPETLAERYERALEEEALLQEIEERPRCHKCSRIVDETWALCPSCHSELKKPCTTCYALLELSWTRCPHCTAEQPRKRPPLTPEIVLRGRQPLVIPTTVSVDPQQSANDAPAPVQQRRYRTTRVGGKEPGQPQSMPGKLIVGDTHPTIIQIPARDADDPMLPSTFRQLGSNRGADHDATLITDPQSSRQSPTNGVSSD